MGAGEEEEQGWAQVPGVALLELVVELPVVPGEMKAPGLEAGVHLPGNAPGVRGGEASQPFEALQMQDEAGPSCCLQPSLGSVCSSRGQSSWEPHQPVPPGCLSTRQPWHRIRAAPPPPASWHRRAGTAGLRSGRCGSRG